MSMINYKLYHKYNNMPKRYIDATSILEHANDSSDDELESKYDVPYEEAFPSDNIYIPDEYEEWENRPRISLEEIKNKNKRKPMIMCPVSCTEKTKSSLWTKIYIKDNQIVMKDFIKKYRKRKFFGEYKGHWIELVRKNKEYFILWNNFKLPIKTKTREIAIKLIENKLNYKPKVRKTSNKKKSNKKKNKGRKKKRY